MSEYKKEELSQDLYGLEKALRRALLASKEFKNIKRKIKNSGLEISVLLAVMAGDGKERCLQLKNKKGEFKLSAPDKEFLKAKGIKW
ncbi:MAG: hypothetical protein NTZ48_03195 [Candidatus Omnitrophica bacterium]|nr:hypothetical protein [Candidatus Omnitrophota bacterium]